MLCSRKQEPEKMGAHGEHAADIFIHSDSGQAGMKKTIGTL
jgi:hypothetical protein